MYSDREYLPTPEKVSQFPTYLYSVQLKRSERLNARSNCLPAPLTPRSANPIRYAAQSRFEKLQSIF